MLEKVCPNCFKDLELQSYIESSTTKHGNCIYCSSSEVELLDLEELLDFFAEFVELFKKDPNGIPLIEIIQKDWLFFTNRMAGTKLLSDILATLNGTLKHPNTEVSYLQDITDNISYWEQLKNDIKWNRRYLSKLSDIEDLGWDKHFYEVTHISPNETLYRARIHYEENGSPFPVDKMGAPPNDKVGEGRANPMGIPYLYLSKSKHTTLYETRALLHDEISIGEFKVKKGSKVSLVDFTEKSGAFMGAGFLMNHAKRILLKKLISKDLSKPIRRYDSIIEYVPTQFICEYLRYIIQADGIIFESSLHPDGQNIVLFSQDKVECTNVEKVLVTALDIKYQ